MGNKITDELLSTVRSIVDSGYSDMDIIRALHMANNDVTAAINIIFDTPSLKSKPPPDFPTIPKIPTPEAANSKPSAATSGDEVAVDDVARSGEWWLVGCGEVAGLSTSRGRRIKPGDEVDFTFPVKVAPSPGKVFGRGRPAAAACSEIVRFSTKESGEVVICVY